MKWGRKMSKYKEILRKNIGGITVVGLLNIASSFAMVFAGYSLAFLFTAYEYERNRVKALIITFGIVLAIWLAAMGIYGLSLLAQARIRRKIKTDLRVMIGEKIASLDYQEFTQKDSGNYVSWLNDDVDQVYNQSFAALFSGIENLAAAIFSLAALCLLSGYIGGAAVILLIVISVLPQLTSGKLQRANAARSEAMEVSTEGYKDVVMGGSIFFLSNLRERIVERITGVSEKAELANYRFSRTNVGVQMLISTVSMIGQVILLFVTLLAAAEGAAPAGAALSVGNLAGSFFNGAGDLVQSFMTVKSAKPLWEKFERSPEGNSEEKQEIKELPSIGLEGVSYRYGDHLVLHDKSFTFRAGGKYAIMGESGSGKTTLTKIILGLLPGYTGEVRYSGLEQGQIALGSLYDRVAYVDQQVYLFQDTLRFNITLGENYSDVEIMAVVKQCRLEEYVKSLPEGLDTVILENGKNLSGGQRQRIALARGLIRRVDYIILDEGTSALDEENALDIETSLMDNRRLGVLIITHHLREEIREKLTAVYRLEAEKPCGAGTV